MQGMKKLFSSIALLYIALLALFTVLIIAVHLIPSSAIEPQFQRSVDIFAAEGDYPYKSFLGDRVMVDNYTDAYMHNVAYCADASRPVDAAMRNYRYRDNVEMNVSMRHLASGKLLNEPFEYGKYWHGYLVFLRPLLTVMDYGQIRILNGIILAALLLVTLVLLARRLSVGVALCLVVSMLLVHSAVLAWSLQYSTCYYIALVGMIALLGFKGLTATRHRLLLCFFAIGASTAFFDFLTTPVVTLGLPLTVVVLLDEKRSTLRLVIALCATWLVGYGLMWASKWLMAILLAGYNPLEEASNSIRLQSVGKGNQPVWAFWQKMLDMFAERWSLLSPKGLFRWALIAVLAVPALFAPKGRFAFSRYTALLFVAMLAPLWYFAVARHSYTHFIITSRTLLVWWFAVLCFLYQNIDFKKLKSHVSNKS